MRVRGERNLEILILSICLIGSTAGGILFFKRERKVKISEASSVRLSSPSRVELLSNTGRLLISEEKIVPIFAETPKEIRNPANELQPVVGPWASTPAPKSISIERPGPTPVILPTASATGIPDKIGMSIYTGIGLNYFQYNQSLTDLVTSYKGIKGPSYNFGVTMEVTDQFAIQASYKQTPLFFDNASVGLSMTKEKWKTVILQGIKRSQKYKQGERSFVYHGGDWFVDWLYGVQYHQLPLALFENTTNEPILRKVQLVNASVGAQYTYYFNPWTRSPNFMRLQYPFSSGSMGGGSIVLTPQFTFDGSVGLEKQLMPQTWLGLYWYGQYQRFKFKYKDSVVTANGTQSAIFSTIELRLNFDF